MTTIQLKELGELIGHGTHSTQEYQPEFYIIQEKKRKSEILKQIGFKRFKRVIGWLYLEPPEGLGMSTRHR